MNNKKIISIVIISTLLLMLCSCSLKKGNDNNSSLESETEHIQDDLNVDEDIHLDPIDANEYLASIGEIKKECTASEQNYLLSESDVLKMLSDRGFVDIPVYSHYNLAGEYYIDSEINPDSSEKHPNYSLQFQSERGILWSIIITGNDISAMPVSFLINESIEHNIVYSENDVLTFYDNVSDRFFEVDCDKNIISNYKMDYINGSSGMMVG